MIIVFVGENGLCNFSNIGGFLVDVWNLLIFVIFLQEFFESSIESFFTLTSFVDQLDVILPPHMSMRYPHMIKLLVHRVQSELPRIAVYHH